MAWLVRQAWGDIFADAARGVLREENSRAALFVRTPQAWRNVRAL